MGYYTQYRLEVNTPKGYEKTSLEIIADLRDSNATANYSLMFDGSCNNESKSYDHEGYLKEFSLKYPEVVFKLIGKGEESEDFWITYFKDGKMQHCPGILTYEPYDEKKLS